MNTRLRRGLAATAAALAIFGGASTVGTTYASAAPAEEAEYFGPGESASSVSLKYRLANGPRITGSASTSYCAFGFCL
jgi:hypothetical protein